MRSKRAGGLVRLVPFGALLALLLLALTSGAAAARNSSHLSSAAVSPRHVTPSETVAFSVVYTDHAGAAPRSVTVLIDQTPAAMTRNGGAFDAGATYTYSKRLTVGHHSVDFAAIDAAGEPERVGAGSVWVSDGSGDGSGGTTGGDIEPGPGPVTTPQPAPVKTPAPTTRPAPAPTSAPAPTAPTGGTVTPDPTPAPTAGYVPDPTDAPDPSDAPDSGVVPWDGGTPAATEAPDSGSSDHDGSEPGTNPTPAPDGVVPVGPGSTAGPTAPDGAALPGEQADPTAAPIPAAGIVDPGRPNAGPASATANRGGTTQGKTHDSARIPMPTSRMIAELAPTIATTTAATTAWAAFVIFGRRRRDGEQPAPDEALAAAAATALEAAAATALPGAPDESLLPRWRRPSLQAARKTDPLRMVSEAPRLTFEASPVPALDGYERRQVRYRLVRLLDSPDELYSTEIGLLDQGDEVQLVERRGAYWRVLCPDGREGWLHRMTLADQAALPSERPVEAVADREPEVRGDDILDAYLRARHQAGKVD